VCLSPLNEVVIDEGCHIFPYQKVEKRPFLGWRGWDRHFAVTEEETSEPVMSDLVIICHDFSDATRLVSGKSPK